MPLTIPPAGSPEFMVLWNALQQYVDNAVGPDEVDDPEDVQPDYKLAQEMLAKFDERLAAIAPF